MDAAESVEYATELANIARAEVLADYLRLRLVRSIAVPQPAAGTEWVQAVPAGAIWELIGVQEQFAASAVVATRSPSLIARDVDGTQVARFGPSSTVAAGVTNTFEFWTGIGTTTSVGPVVACLPTPPLPLQSGYTIRSQTGSLDAGDQYSLVVLTVREWSIGQVYWLADLVARDLSFEAQRERRA